MKYEKTSDGRIEAVIDSFGGLDRASALCGGRGSFELRNFRSMADGTLVRREGLVPVVTLDGEIRGATGIERGGVDEVYAVAGKTVYCLSNGETGYTANPIGMLTSESGRVDFLCHGGALLLLDGDQLYTLTPGAADMIEAYVPLYGKDWLTADSTTHVMYEAPNVLSRRLRITYVLAEASRHITLRSVAPESVDAIVINGELYAGNFSYSSVPSLVTINDEMPMGAQVEIYLTMPESFFEKMPKVTAARRMAAIGRAEEERVMFYDLPDEASVYISHATDKAQRERVRAVLPTACMLYVTEADRVTVGDGVHAVTGACRHYDRSLIFTARGTWMSDGSEKADGTLALIPVNTALGCSVAGGFSLSGNDPMTVQGSRVLRWNSQTDERDECNAVAVSLPVETLMSADFGKCTAIFADAARGEIWFYRPGVTGRILIYQTETEQWTCFDGFAPTCVFGTAGKVAVGMERTVYIMDETATADMFVTEEHPEGVRIGIEAEYKSSFVDLGISTRSKRVCGMAVVASCGDGALCLTVYNVNGRQRKCQLRGSGDAVSVMQTRGNIGRFRFLRVGIRADDDGPLRLHEVRLSAHGG